MINMKITFYHTEGTMQLNSSGTCREFIIILTSGSTLIYDVSILCYLQQTSVLYYLYED